ncbi:MAG: FG-GAP-like repeat-containing protein [Thermoanaerobaculia bacterium]
MTIARRSSALSATLAVGGLLVLALLLRAAAVSDRAVELRNRGFAELENEQPSKAETAFRELVGLTPGDPLASANLAIALLRQQKTDAALEAIHAAEATTPRDARLIAIRGEILTWSGHNDAGLEAFREAAKLAPEDAETQYTLYRNATAIGGEDAAEATDEALDRLAKLRPENLVVMLQIGKSAREHGDRARATGAYLRIRELVWQAPANARADQLLDGVLDKLEENDLAGARVPSLRLENVLKVTAMYRESLRELQTGIQGVPLRAFRNEPPVTSFGTPAKVRFEARQLVAGTGSDVQIADLDGDHRPELIRLSEGAVQVLDADGNQRSQAPAEGARRLLVADIDNDGSQDILAYGPGAAHFFTGSGDGRLATATAEFGLGEARGGGAAVIDFDIEGDLDLLVTGDSATELFRNNLQGALQPVASRSLPKSDLNSPADVVASDLDRDGDLDLAILDENGVVRFDNLRQGRFELLGDQIPADDASRLASADLDNDGWPDLVVAGGGVGLWHNREGTFEPWDLGETLRTSARFTALSILDADNDGRLDLAVGGAAGLVVLAQRADGFAFLQVAGTARADALAAGDIDGDGDVDLAAQNQDGLFIIENQGGNNDRWLALRLKGLSKGNGKNNGFGLGATIEVRAGSAYQFREVTGDVTHFGLGQLKSPDLIRVVWTNGVPQNRFDPTPNQLIVEEQLLKGSCPFVYSWNGEGFEFETDLLWGAPAGLPVADGVWAGADPQELVRLDALAADDGRFQLRVTEELWEAAFFDYSRLWIVDHPDRTEVASSLRIVPGRVIEDRILASHSLEPVAAAWDASGREVTHRVADRDEVYADGWIESRYQGVSREPWTFELDLGRAPARAIRLHLDGWIFPADASLNLALDQRSDLTPAAPHLEMLTGSGWKTLVEEMGHPAGKTKTMVIDTPPLPEGVRRLRIVSNQWLSWDRIAWTTTPADDAAEIRARLAPETAELRFRGFSRMVRQAANAPHSFEYGHSSADSPWLSFPGRYTRYGDVRELLAEPDSRSVVMGAGDEMVLVFDGTSLPEIAPGWKRSYFLESHGWDKDADRNTFAAAQVEPLPFRGMSGYPYRPDEAFPDTPLHREYLETYQTRIVD